MPQSRGLAYGSAWALFGVAACVGDAPIEPAEEPPVASVRLAVTEGLPLPRGGRRLLATLEIYNRHARPRWFLVPRYGSWSPSPLVSHPVTAARGESRHDIGRVVSLEIETWGPHGGYRAFCVPGEGAITVVDLPVEVWESPAPRGLTILESAAWVQGTDHLPDLVGSELVSTANARVRVRAGGNARTFPLRPLPTETTSFAVETPVEHWVPLAYASVHAVADAVEAGACESWAPALGEAPRPRRRGRFQLVARGWYPQAETLADRYALGAAFEARGYEPPQDTYILATRVVEGAGQPGFQYYSYGDTAFQYSRGRFWVASTIKIFAAVGALMVLAEHGADTETLLGFDYVYGSYQGTVADIIHPINNLNYDRLLLIAGIDQLNTMPERARLGIPRTVVTRGYSGRKLADSPAMRVGEGKRQRLVAPRPFAMQGYPPGCQRNCTTLLEIQEILRRVVLHRQLPPEQRFPLVPADADDLRSALRDHSYRFLEPAVTTLFGEGVEYFNKAGNYPGLHMLDNVLVATRAGEQFLFTVASPWPKEEESHEPSVARLNEIAFQSLSTLLELAADGPWLQSNAGHLEVGFAEEQTAGWVALAAGGPTYDRVQLFVGHERVQTRDGVGRFAVKQTPVPVVAIGYWGEAPAAYRILSLERTRSR